MKVTTITLAGRYKSLDRRAYYVGGRFYKSVNLTNDLIVDAWYGGFIQGLKLSGIEVDEEFIYFKLTENMEQWCENLSDTLQMGKADA